MENQEERAAKKQEELFWRKCPICGQEFTDFLPLIMHLEEHSRLQSQMVKVELGAKDYLAKQIAEEFLPSVERTETGSKPGPHELRASKRKLADEGRGLLSVVADWIEQALTTFSEINAIVTSDLKVAEELFAQAPAEATRNWDGSQVATQSWQSDPICGGIDGGG